MSRIGKVIETESLLLVAWGREGWGKWGMIVNGYGVSFWDDDKCSRIDCGDGFITVNILKTLESKNHFKQVNYVWITSQ